LNDIDTKNQTTRKSTTAEFLVVVTIIVGLCFLIAPAVKMARNPRGPHGYAVPRDEPDEKNRIHCETGFSIVLPTNWEVSNTFKTELWIGPRHGPGRAPAFLTVFRHEDYKPDDLTGFQKTTFRGLPAYEQMVVEREAVLFDDPARSRFSLWVDLNGEWIAINYVVSERHTELPKSVRKFIETLQWSTEIETSRN
jgi:hypothetical protein